MDPRGDIEFLYPENRKVDVETSATRAEIETVLAEAGYPATREAV